MPRLRDADPQAWQQVISVNVLGVHAGSLAYLRHLEATQHKGVLINVSSGAATSAYAGWSAYCASKAAVDILTRCLAEEEKDRGRVRAYSVAPGVIDTNMQSQIRGTDVADFPMVDKFHQLKEQDAFSSPAWVAKGFAELAFGGGDERVVLRLPPEP